MEIGSKRGLKHLALWKVIHRRVDGTAARGLSISSTSGIKVITARIRELLNRS
jgi:hypothetical protein